MSSLTVEIRGSDLPGQRCGPNPEGRMYGNVHVGLARRADTVELVRGDAPSARWAFEVTVRRDEQGTLDFGGPFVYGGAGERSLGLRWGTLASDDTFEVFRAAKLRLSALRSSWRHRLRHRTVRGRRASARSAAWPNQVLPIVEIVCRLHEGSIPQLALV